jgi:hypothetical protein
MNIRNFLLVNALPCIAALTLSDVAEATNNYPGLQCIALSGTAQPDSSGHIQNSSTTTTATVLCPVFVDASVSGQSTSGTPSVFVTDQNFNTNVCCSSRLKNTGQSVISGGTLCTSGTNPAADQLVLTNPATPGGNFTFTHRWLQCDIPPIFSGALSEVRFYRY